MAPDDLEFLAQLLKDRSGLVLTKDKGYLLENRLMPVVRGRQFKKLADMIGALRLGNAGLTEDAVDAMLPKDTGFFRDWTPFEHFRKVVITNALKLRSAKKTLRVLCAGVSTGQEAYSIAMAVHEARGLVGWPCEIVGIDLSPSALKAAEAAVYSQFDVQRGLPIRVLLKYFTKDEESWRLNDPIRAIPKFQFWNVLDDLFPLGRFDVILCRNVLPYFDMQTKFNVVQKLSRALTDDGVLYVGLREPLSGVSTSVKAADADLGIYVVNRAERGISQSLADPV
ncbi:MAG: protein-glutamate O-methyltransferase CheR [Rhodospirillaceae bacterium]|nr:protein-glutamate O-methyltransferase CheR [Rhodospirillaceae bacterium]